MVSLEVTKFEGSPVITEFPLTELSVRHCLAKREQEYCLDAIDGYFPRSLWLNYADCVIDSSRNNSLLKTILARIPSRELKAVSVLFKEITNQKDLLLTEMIGRYSKLERKHNRSKDYKQLDSRTRIWTKCCDNQTRKKIRKYLQLERIIELRLNENYTLTRIAAKLNLSLNKVSDLWRQLRESKLNNVVQLHHEILNRISTNDFLQQYFDNLLNGDEHHKKTAVQLYDEAKIMYKGTWEFTFSYFFAAFKQYGFLHKSIRYEARAAKVVNGWHLQNFLNVYLHFLLVSRRFRILFIDESSICPSNFKKKAWRYKKESSNIPSRIKYEKIMMIGAMSQTSIIGFQLLHSNFSKDVFANFIYRLSLKEIQQLKDGQQLVLFLDNCSTHRYQSLMEFCRLNNIVLFFNLPRKSELNPIEFLWEFIKRPFRQMTTYKR